MGGSHHALRSDFIPLNAWEVDEKAKLDIGYEAKIVNK